MLEQLKHNESCFCTLTYATEHLPESGSLSKRDLQLWLKRLRKEIPTKIRYYAVGEYGDRTWRPHYHAALYGVSYLQAKIIEGTWKKGMIHIGELTKESAQYICGYVVKKLTNGKDPEVIRKLAGREPEFCRMSLRPGIGASAMIDVADAVMSSTAMSIQSDVPGVLRHGPRLMPLGRYLKKKLRALCWIDEEEASKEGMTAYKSEILAEVIKTENVSKSIKKIISEKNQQKVIQTEVRHRIFSKTRSL